MTQEFKWNEPNKSLFETAKERVRNSDKLSEHADFILADWPQGDAHWFWVINSTDEQILDWVQV